MHPGGASAHGEAGRGAGLHDRRTLGVDGPLDLDFQLPGDAGAVAVGGILHFHRHAETYLGFGLPVLLESLLPVAGPTIPLFVLAAVAVGSAAIRTVQLRAGVFAAR